MATVQDAAVWSWQHNSDGTGKLLRAVTGSDRLAMVGGYQVKARVVVALHGSDWAELATTEEAIAWVESRAYQPGLL